MSKLKYIWSVNVDCSNTSFIKSICKYCGSNPIIRLAIPNKTNADNIKNIFFNPKFGNMNIFNIPMDLANKSSLRYINIHKDSSVTTRIKKITKGPTKDRLVIRERMKINTTVSKDHFSKIDFFGSETFNVSNILSCKCFGTFWSFVDPAYVSQIHKAYHRSKLSFVNKSINLFDYVKA